MESNLKVSEPLVAPQSSTITQPVPTGTWVWVLLRDMLETALPALLIAAMMVVYVVQPTRVDGSSMEPSLHSGQRLVIDKLSLRLYPPEHGEVVVFKLPMREDTPLIKRVIATAGDTVAIRDGKVYLNGEPLRETGILATPGELATTVVPEGYIFVLGDNRAASNDSRNFGMVPLKDLVGRAVVSYWPPETVGLVR